jgi:hypothetical protein
MVGSSGFEPEQRQSKCLVQPLHYEPIKIKSQNKKAPQRFLLMGLSLFTDLQQNQY